MPVAADKTGGLPRPDGLPSVEGLDTEDGLNRLVGERELYLKLLRQFAEQQGAAPAQINEALASNDTRLAERLAHTVKGVAGNLGAHTVQCMAAKLEKAIAGTTPSAQLAPVLSEFGTVLEDFFGRLRAALPPEKVVTSAAPPDPAQVKRVVPEMITLLSSFDPAAVECLEANRAVFRTLLPGGMFASFVLRVNGFDFAEALAQLQPAAQEKGLLSV